MGEAADRDAAALNSGCPARIHALHLNTTWLLQHQHQMFLDSQLCAICYTRLCVWTQGILSNPQGEVGIESDICRQKARTP